MKNLFLFILFILFAGGCNITDPAESPLNKIIFDSQIEYSLTLAQNTFSLQDTLHINLTVKNNSSADKIFSFYNQQQLGFQIINKFNKVTIDFPFATLPATSGFTLQPGEKKELSTYSVLKDRNENFIDEGNYILSAFLLENNSPKISLAIFIK